MRTLTSAALSLLLTVGITACASGPSATTSRASIDGMQAQALEARRFRILQINDVYKIEGLEEGTIGGLARVRTLRQQLEADGTPVLLLHGGDVLYPSVMSKYFEAKPMIEILNLLDGDPEGFDERMLLVFGNHEFDRSSPDILLGRLQESDFAWLSSNVYFRPEDAHVQPFHRISPSVFQTRVLDLNGLKVGIFGLTLDDQKRDYVHYDYGPAQRSEGPDEDRHFRLEDVAVRAALAALYDQGAEVIIALTHQEMEHDERLARAFPEIDVVIGGHEHIHLEAQVEGTWITKADSDARTAWVYDIDASDPAALQVDKCLLDIDSTLALDAVVQTPVDAWIRRLEEKVPTYNKVYGSTVHDLIGEEAAIRGRETALGNWLADVVRGHMKTDVALINGGSIRLNDNILAGGDIRGEHLEGIFYFDGSLVSFEITGDELLGVLEHSVSLADSGAGRFLQVSGVRFQYRKVSTDGQSSFEILPDSVEVLDPETGEYQPLNARATYSAATSHYMWSRGSESDGYQLFAQHAGGTSPTLTAGENQDIDWRGITEAWLAKNSQVTVDVEGRITRLSGPSQSEQPIQKCQSMSSQSRSASR